MVAVAAATWAGVLVARPMPIVVGGAVLAAGFAVRRGWLLGLGAALLGSGLAAASWAALVPVTAAPYAGTVRLATDPGEVGGAVRADADLADGRRVELWARGRSAPTVRGLLAGELVPVAGRLEPPPQDAPWLAPRHVVGRLSLTSVDPLAEIDAGRPWDRVANDVHRFLGAGAEALPAEQRPLFLGFVLGDDRGQDPAVVSDFRGAGLSHLLVVSGENVAFVLALAGPLLARGRLGLRLALTLSVLAWFALLTRFEPSVLRATCMAAVAALGSYRGLRVSAARVLALAVTALLLVDPLLQGALGFRLSVAASAAIVAVAPRLAPHLPGPARVRQAVAVSVAAQMGVAPVLLPAFGSVPAVSVLANLLAVPAAGPVMMWGLVAGPAAGALRAVGAPAAATVLVAPIHVLLGWVAGVAQVAANAPVGSLGAAHLVGLAAALGAFMAAGRRSWPVVRAGAAGVFVTILLLPAVAGPPAPLAHEELGRGFVLWRDPGTGAALAELSGAVTRPDEVLDDLRERGVRRLDALVVRSTSRSASEAAAAVRSRLEVGDLWQPADGRILDATTPRVGDEARIGDLAIVVRSVSPQLEVDVRVPPGPV